MNRKKLVTIVLALALVLTGTISVLTAVAAPIAQEGSTDDSDANTQEDADTEDTDTEDEDSTAGDATKMGEQEEIKLATIGLSTTLVQPGRAIVHARGNHFVVDSVPPLGGLNEERNPLDLMLGSLATCGLFVFEAGAAESGMPLESLSVAVEADLAPQGLKDGSVNPRIREFRVMIDAQGISDEEFDILHEQWKLRCPAYTTLIRSAPIEVIRVNHEMDDTEVDEAAEKDQIAGDEDDATDENDEGEDEEDKDDSGKG